MAAVGTGSGPGPGPGPLSVRFLPLLCCCLAPVFGIARDWELSLQPKPCRAPEQWEGRAVVYEHSTGRNSRVLLSYDGHNQRVRVLEEKKGHIPCKKFYEYIYLFKNPVLFKIEQVTKHCSKLPLIQPWDPYDIPDNSTYEDEYNIGGPGDQIKVQEWSDRKPARKYGARTADAFQHFV
ncbi:mammalian ependymin-related protein 1 isoform X2 [Carcharodon carcharias]|uniref:mammalian ependymin-related protein 1 isoform X2 n=1 Tax=Carcharodon carcharias TaxID=13397 RepID=UPI001B7E74D0|nr:mammalian ependymin-related protein 1 isoform X2 [Carcharodon carcharias]